MKGLICMALFLWLMANGLQTIAPFIIGGMIIAAIMKFLDGK